MKFKSFAKKGLVAVAVTGALVMVSTGVEYNGDFIGGLNDKLAKLESMLGVYSSRYQKDKDTISKLQDEIAKLKEQLATSNGDKSDLETQLDKAEKEIAKYKADLTALAGALGIEMDETMGFDTPEKYETLKSAINDEIEAKEDWSYFIISILADGYLDKILFLASKAFCSLRQAMMSEAFK